MIFFVGGRATGGDRPPIPNQEVIPHFQSYKIMAEVIIEHPFN